MGRRGRSRKTGQRTALGVLSRAGQVLGPVINGYSLSHRLEAFGDDEFNELAAKTRRAQRDIDQQLSLTRAPPTPQVAAQLRDSLDTVRTADALARNPNLTALFPLGLAYEQSRKADADLAAALITQPQRDALFILGEAEFKAGMHYAMLHRSVWGGLPADIERALGPQGYNLLLETGPVKSPTPPASLFRNLLPSDPSAVPDPEEAEKRRLRHGEKLGEARTRLMSLSGDYWYCSVVESVVIEGRLSPWISGPVKTADQHMRRSALAQGLRALAALFGFDRYEQGPPAAIAAAPVAPKAATTASAPLPADRRPSKRPGRPFDVVFSPESDAVLRPDKDTTARAIELFKTRRRPKPAA